MMIPYTSKSGKKSKVTAYEIGSDFIIVEFNYKTKYKYSYGSTGSTAVEAMKKCAIAAEGLSTYISGNNPNHENDNPSSFFLFINKWIRNKNEQSGVV